MGNEFYAEIDNLFKSVIDFLNQFNQSEILQNAIYNLFETNVYSNLIKNIFLNLTDENIAEYGISKEELYNFELEFKNVLKDVEDILSKDLTKKIDLAYYNNFKQDVKNKFPVFVNFIKEFEEKLGIVDLSEYMKEKKKLISESGVKDDSDIELLIKTRILEEDFQNNERWKSDINLPKDFASRMATELIEKSLKIKEWNIWHSYSTFLVEDGYELEDIAYKLVEMNLCPIVLGQNLTIWWKENNQVNKTTLKILEANPGGIRVQWPKIIDRYILGGLNQLLIMWHAESNLFNEKYRSSFDYIKGFMNPCMLKSGKRSISLYPQLKFFNNGTITFSFRQISPVFDNPIDSFIEHEVNLYRNTFEKIEIAPEIMKLSGRFFNYKSLKLRDYNLSDGTKIIKKMDEDIAQRTQHVREGDFSFNFVDISNPDQKFTLDDLFNFFNSALAYVINFNSKHDIPVIGDLKFNYGNFFTLRPSIYLTDFTDQPYRSGKIQENFGNDLGKIMARTYQPIFMDFSKFLGENLREFEDYCLYVNKALTLWVFTKSGSDFYKNNSRRKNDPNLSFIYEKQVQVECVDHLNISLKRLSEISSDLSISYDSVLKNQLDQADLEEVFMDDISNFGEINKILLYASKELNWDNLRAITKNRLKIRSDHSNVKRDEIYKNLAYLTTLIFGVIGASTFVDKVTKPTWSYLNLPVIPNENLQLLLLVVVTILIIFLIIGVAWLIISKKAKKKLR